MKPVFTSVAQWITTSFPIIRIVLLAMLVFFSILMVLAVLLQPSNSEGMGALGGQSSDTYYAKNKAKSLEGTLKRLTIILGICIAAICILFFVSIVIYPVGI